MNLLQSPGYGLRSVNPGSTPVQASVGVVQVGSTLEEYSPHPESASSTHLFSVELNHNPAGQSWVSRTPL
jgi:hypothetical protein